MDVTIPVGQQKLATAVEAGAQNPPVYTWVMDDTTVATFVDNGNGTALVTAVKPGLTGFHVNDSANNLTALAAVTVDAVGTLQIIWS